MASFTAGAPPPAAAADGSIFEAIADGLIAGDNTDAVKDVCVKTLLVFVRNVLKDPSNPKFRRIRATNAKIVERVLSPSGGREFLDALGFVEEGEFLVLPPTANLATVQAGQTVLLARAPAPTPTKAAKANAAGGSSSSSKATPTPSRTTPSRTTPSRTTPAAAARSPADAEDAARRKAYEERMSAVKAKRAKDKAERAKLRKAIKGDQQQIKDKREVRATKASQATSKAFGANKAGWEDIGVKLSDCGGGG